MIPGFAGHLISEVVLERRTLVQLSTVGAAARIATARRRMAVAWRRAASSLGPASSLTALVEIGAEPVARALGFSREPPPVVLRGAVFITLSARTEPVGLLVCPWGQPLDTFWRTAVVEARQRGIAWVFLFNGMRLRLVEAARPYSRRHAEFEIDLVMDDDESFARFWTACGAAAFSATSPGGLLIASIVRESEQHATEVCRSLRSGVLDASASILRALAGRRPSVVLDASFEQSLTIVYRILFLLFAEARGLVPLWHAVYRQSYSIESLREAAERHGPAPGLWDALRASSHLAHAGCVAGDLRVSAFNGRLFAPSRTPLAERRGLDDEAARRAVLALTTRATAGGRGRERIAYRDLGVEQIGAVYEALLDYAPARGPTVSLQPGSGRRKATGTFYTPQSLAEYLVRQTIEPLVCDKSPADILRLRVLDPAMGSGAFLVAAVRYLARAYEMALVRQGGCHAADLGPVEQALIRRTVAERCLFGVDVNPMAVQLARLSLWLATLAIDRPLSFLDHHLLTGDSLLGAWLTCLERPPVSARRRRSSETLPLFADLPIEPVIRSALPVRFTLGLRSSDTVEEVRAKEQALAALNRADSSLSRWRRVADLWCAQWFSSTGFPAPAFRDLSDVILGGRSALSDRVARACLTDAEAVAAARRFFHWELEFPEVFFDERGERLVAPGFDAIVGNPPWDMVRADSGDDNHRARARRDEGQVLRFIREAGVYEATPGGHTNRYQLFVERAVTLVKGGGRLGLVLPSGLAVDHGSASLRRLLFSRCDVDDLVGFDNRRGIFPVHRSVRFVLLTATGGRPTRETGCRLGLADLAALDPVDDRSADVRSRSPVRVTPALLERLTGADMAVPDFRSAIDLAIAERSAALFPPLGSDSGWAARFGRELNATDDRGCLRRPPARGLPVVGGRQIEPFRMLADAPWRITPAMASRHVGDRHLHARLAYRDVAAATNRLTLIAAILPAGCVSTHTLFCLRTRVPSLAQHFLCALFNSFVLNYLVRLRVTTHVTTAIVERLPVPAPGQAPTFREVAAFGRCLGRRHDPHAFARLNARVAELYGLSEQEFTHVLGTFPLVPRAERDLAASAYRELCARP
jgi:hypothetical protein